MVKDSDTLLRTTPGARISRTHNVCTIPLKIHQFKWLGLSTHL